MAMTAYVVTPVDRSTVTAGGMFPDLGSASAFAMRHAARSGVEWMCMRGGDVEFVAAPMSLTDMLRLSVIEEAGKGGD